MTKLTCGTHGEQEETFVCDHIIETLKDGEPRGFCWNHVDGQCQAICTACNEMTDEEFTASQADAINILCYGCFLDAAALNGVDIG